MVLILGSSMNKIIKRQESPSWSSSWRPLTLMALEANKDETGWPGTPADAPRPPKLKKQRIRKLVQQRKILVSIFHQNVQRGESKIQNTGCIMLKWMKLNGSEG